MTGLTVRDLEKSGSVLDGFGGTAQEVVHQLEAALVDRLPFFCVLESAGSALVVGVGDGFGCVQHSGADRQPPYWMAVAPVPRIAEESCGFLSGGQISEVSRRYCLPWSALREAVVFFAEHGGAREPRLQWEAI